MTSATTDPRLSVSLCARAFGAGDLGAYRDAVSTLIQTMVDDLGLPAGIDSDVAIGEQPRLCQVSLGGRELLLSARRRLSVAAGVFGAATQSSLPKDVDSYLIECAVDSTSDQRLRFVAEHVRACVLTNLEAVVGACATASAGQSAPGSGDEGESARLRAAVELARFGVAPIRIEEVWAAGDPSADADEQRRGGSVSAFRFDEFPTLEMNEQTLRWLTETPGLDRPWSVSSAGPLTGLSTSKGVSAALWTTYGIDLREIRLDVEPTLADDRFRIRFGEITTSPYLLLPADLVALKGRPTWLDVVDVRRWILDPIGGDWLPAIPVEQIWKADIAETPYLDAIALMMRTLFAEIQTRLARWPAYDATDGWIVVLADPLKSRLSEALPEVVRRLLSDGVSVGQPAPVIEGMMRGLVDTDGSPNALVNSTRRVLGAAVIGLVPPEHTVELLILDSGAVGEAIRIGAAEPLLRAHPELVTTTLTHIVVCDEDQRPMVADLLRPLVDVVRVVTMPEIAEAAINLPASRTA